MLAHASITVILTEKSNVKDSATIRDCLNVYMKRKQDFLLTKRNQRYASNICAVIGFFF